ncbi:MAG: glycosyltransferase [Coriobacteriia bacterium]|nr:glycosyltransferase [Coriobacteriia bacterium]
MISVFFILDEAYSLFPGGEGGPRFGGAGLQMYLLADELSKDSELDVHWVFLSAWRPIGVSLLSHPRITISNTLSSPEDERLRIGPLPIPFGRTARRFVRRARGIEEPEAPCQSPYPKVFISSIGGSAPFLLREAGRVDNAKTILRLSSDTDTINPRWCDRPRDEMFKLYRAIDRIVTQTNKQHDLLLENASVKSTQISNMWPIPSNTPSYEREHVLWVASAQALKQPWIFLNLAKQFPSERFVMVMPVANEVQLAEYVIRQASSVDNLTVIDEQVPLEELVEYFAKAKVFVNTSEIEGFPNTFLQAGAARTPILSFGINPDDMLNIHKMGICADGDVDRLVEGLATLLGDESLRKECGDNGFAYVREVHSSPIIAAQWKALIMQLATLRRGE